MNLSYQKDIIIFLCGGALFYLIFVLANIIKNPGLAAIVSLLPISLFCCLFMETKPILQKYLQSLMVVFSISLSLVIIGYYWLRHTKTPQLIVISCLIGLWVLIQLLVYFVFTGKFKVN